MNLKPEQSNIFFKLMEERYRQHPTIITTNLVYDEWPNFLGNRPMVEALAEPAAALLPHRAHRRSVVARTARLRTTAWTTASQEEYVRQVLEAYRKTPGTMGTVRRADRLLAAQLYQRGVSVRVIENALVLAATRRLVRPADAPPLGTIRSLAYFLPVIEEVLDLRVSPDYFEYLRYKLARIAPMPVACPRPASAPSARMMEKQPARLRRG